MPRFIRIDGTNEKQGLGSDRCKWGNFDALAKPGRRNSHRFDGALYTLCSAGRISEEEALRASDSPNNLRLLLERLGGGKATPGEVPLRLVTSPEAQVRRQTMKLQAQKGPPGAAPGKASTLIPAVVTPGSLAATGPLSTRADPRPKR